MTRNDVHSKRTTCRACGSSSLRSFLHLGETALANSFLKSEDEFASEERFPLEVVFCEGCTLVQLADVIAPEVMFRDYLYVTGTSDTMAAHNDAYAAAVVDELGLGPDDMVVEVASNDGSLLKRIADRGPKVLGIEPARNVADIARAAGVETIAEFFGSVIADEVRNDRGPAQAVIGNNVLAHVVEPVDFLTGCRKLLGPGGRVINEFPYLGDFVENLEYDTVYHEHLCYFSVQALLTMYERAGLHIERIDRVPVHGGSLRVFSAAADELAEHGPEVRSLAADELERGYGDFGRYERFAAAVADHREELVGLLTGLREQGKTIAGYGAPAKGNTLLSWCGIDRDLLPFIVDKNPLKVGLYTPGTHIPVLPVEALMERLPDFVLILAWNFADEVMEQQAAYRAAGGKFLLPLPHPRLL